MGRPEQIKREISERFKVERKRRDWSQADVAKMLSDRLGIDVHSTTIGKIETGDRWVRIDELLGIAELLDVSLDSLLGRKTGFESDLAFSLRALLDTARQMVAQLGAAVPALQERFAELAAFEFDGRDAVEREGGEAIKNLIDAQSALFRLSQFELPPDAKVTPPKDVIERAAHKRLLELIGEVSGDETES